MNTHIASIARVRPRHRVRSVASLPVCTRLYHYQLCDLFVLPCCDLPVVVSRFVAADEDVLDSPAAPGKVSSALRLLVKLLFLALIIAIALYFYQVR